MVIIDRLINSLLGGLTLDPAGMHSVQQGTMLLFLVYVGVLLDRFYVETLH